MVQVKMNIITRIRNYFFIRGVINSDPKEMDREFFEQYVTRGFNAYRGLKKGGCERNNLAKSIRILRSEFPYQIEGWHEAEQDYKEYFRSVGAIQKFEDLEEGTYLTKFRHTYPVKGKREYEYGYNYCCTKEGETIQLGECNDKYKYFDLDYEQLREEDITAYRYATKEEVKKYYREEVRRRGIQTRIDKKYKEIEQLRSKL